MKYFEYIKSIEYIKLIEKILDWPRKKGKSGKIKQITDVPNQDAYVYHVCRDHGVFISSKEHQYFLLLNFKKKNFQKNNVIGRERLKRELTFPQITLKRIHISNSLDNFTTEVNNSKILKYQTECTLPSKITNVLSSVVN